MATAQTLISAPDAAVSEAVAATPATEPVASAPTPSAHPITFSIYERARNDNWMWFAAPPDNDSYSYIQSLLRISVAQRIDRWDWQAELAQTWVGPLPNDSVAAVSAQGQLGLGGTYYASNAANTEPVAAFFKQGFLRYNAAPDKNLRLGRFEFFDGTETHPKDSSGSRTTASSNASSAISVSLTPSAASMASTATMAPATGI
jgi:hypothetical protein